MPIPVVCPGCKARFAVSEKFAGKKGPCPKCKNVITIPTPAPVAEEVKIHAPEEYAAGGKDSKGRAVSKPIARQETKVDKRVVGGIVVGVLFVLGMAFVCRGLTNKTPICALGLILIGPPLALGGYSFLREDELEPYRGRSVLIRSAICGLVYAALWGFYLWVSGYLTGEVWQWAFVAPVFIGIGGFAAWASYDLEFGNAALHYCFFLGVTLLLRFVMGIPPIWQSLGGSELTL